jgi:hypothetical protein
MLQAIGLEITWLWFHQSVRAGSLTNNPEITRNDIRDPGNVRGQIIRSFFRWHHQQISLHGLDEIRGRKAGRNMRPRTSAGVPSRVLR